VPPEEEDPRDALIREQAQVYWPGGIEPFGAAETMLSTKGRSAERGR
jgi:hypothetical protein